MFDEIVGSAELIIRGTFQIPVLIYWRSWWSKIEKEKTTTIWLNLAKILIVTFAVSCFNCQDTFFQLSHISAHFLQQLHVFKSKVFSYKNIITKLSMSKYPGSALILSIEVEFSFASLVCGFLIFYLHVNRSEVSYHKPVLIFISYFKIVEIEMRKVKK